jgi:glyoxylase-like metal-dependent hydrolase (beta-lactamase superfamily II)
VKAIVMGHGHADHSGGSPHAQITRPKGYISAADWNLMENPPAGRGRGLAPVLPKHDQVAAKLIVPAICVMPVAILATRPVRGRIFPVKDQGKTRMPRLRRTIPTPGPISDEGCRPT